MSFDATQDGTAAATWDELVAAANPLALTGYTQLLVFAAHADDDTLGAGGLIADFARRGLPVHVVIVTDGSASHPASPSHDGDAVARLRAREARAAIDVLAPGAELTLLCYPDGKTLENREAIEADVAAITARTPASTLIAAPWRGDGHRDHRVVGEICAHAAGARTLLEYPIWMWHWAAPDHAAVPRLVALAIDPELKARAVREHTSQVAPLSLAVGDEPLLRPQFLEHFDRALELYVAPAETLPADYFDALYAKRSDPWRLATRWYEERKRAVTMASLPERRFASALEIGSSIGMLTALLGERCDRVLALDVSAAAARSTRERTGDNVTVRVADITKDFPAGTFDLIVLSEVGYYLSSDALGTLVDEISTHLAENGTVIACHWRHPVTDYLQSGDGVHAIVAARLGLPLLAKHLEDDFVLDVYSRDDRSVAAREGLA